MTYAQIITGLRAAKLNSTADGLERAVESEKDALFNSPGGKYKKRDAGRAAREAAQEFYAQDITALLLEPLLTPTPHQLLDLRRYAVAWAVATVIDSNDLLMEARRILSAQEKRDKTGTMTSSGDIHEGPNEE